ncbi:hypothetical protein LEN26_006438 [Aphanomyces euteiches]|nr:hypothetical protein LEN26_006438 [Aphanomyces euteiches]
MQLCLVAPSQSICNPRRLYLTNATVGRHQAGSLSIKPLVAALTVCLLVAAGGHILLQLFSVLKRKWRIAVSIRYLPGPPSLPIIGNLHQLGMSLPRIHWWKLEMAEQYGGTYATRVDCLMDGSIVTNKPENIEYVLQTNSDNYIKPKMMQETCAEVMGQAIFAINPDSPLWTLQRKLMSSMFSVNSFRKYMKSVFAEHTAKCIATLHAASQKNDTIDMELVLLTLTTDISFHMGFGRHVPAEMNSRHFHNLFRDASTITASRFTKPWYKWFGWCMPSEMQLKAVMAEIDGMFYRIIHTRKMEGASGSSDILSQLVARQKAGEPITDTFLRDMMMTVMLAGRETVASSLLWIIHLISQHPDVEAKVFAEVQGVDAMNYDAVAQLQYLEAVMKETWRLFPPTALELKCAVHDDVLPDGTFVPAGVNVEYSPFVMGRDKTRWTDADKFIPERWLDPSFSPPTDYEYPVFNAGKRKCVGQRIALLQVKYILCSLFQQFRFESAKSDKPRLTLGIALFAHGGLPIVPIARTKTHAMRKPTPPCATSTA